MGNKPRKGTLPRPLMDSLCHICPQLLQHMRLRPPLRPPVGARDMGFHRGQGHELPPGPGTWASTEARDMGFHQGQVVLAGGDTLGDWER